MVESLELFFYQTQFQRGQIDVSSNVAQHLSRLSYYRTEHPPFMPRREFQLTLTGDADSADVACFNYASIYFPMSLLGSGVYGDTEGATLYYFVEFDPDDAGNSVNARVMRFYLDEWATVTSSQNARALGDTLVNLVGTLEQGHDASGSVRLTPIVAPEMSLPITSPYTTLRTGGDVVLIATCTEDRAGDDKVARTSMFCLADPDSNVDRIGSWGSVISTPAGTAMVDIGAKARELVGYIDNYSLIGYDYDDSGAVRAYTFKSLRIESITAVPAELLPSGFSSYPFASPVDVGEMVEYGDGSEERESLGNRLIWIGYGDNGGFSHFKRRDYNLGVEREDVTIFGNVGQCIQLLPSSRGRRVYSALSMRPASATLAVFIGDGVEEMEITETLTVPFSAIADPTARATQGVRDVLSAVNIAGSVAAGVVTQNPVAIAAGVMQAAGFAADVSARGYAATRQTAGAALRNVAANTRTPEVVAGAVRVETFTPANVELMRGMQTRFGWNGARPSDGVRLFSPFAYFKYADDVALTLTGKLKAFPWLASSVRDLLVRGVRVWDDEDATRFKNYAASPAVEE